MNDTPLEYKNTLSKGAFQLVNYLPDIGIVQMRQELWKGLIAAPKYISSKFFYDQRGSELFEAITQLDEYYPTRTEKQILAGLGNKLEIKWQGLNIIELGSGDHSKISLLLRHVPETDLASITYSPVDISPTAMEKAARRLIKQFPHIQIKGIVADFIRHLDRMPWAAGRLFCFFGSTIGNLDRRESETFMERLGLIMQPGEHLLLGLDMVKDVAVLERAYNDARQITSAFNRNILNVVNHFIDTDFEPHAFRHLAFYNKKEQRIEMHLQTLNDMVISSKFRKDKIYLKQGETIHTENSYKFTADDIKRLGQRAGLETVAVFSDPQGWFSLVYYKKKD